MYIYIYIYTYICTHESFRCNVKVPHALTTLTMQRPSDFDQAQTICRTAPERRGNTLKVSRDFDLKDKASIGP